METFLLRNTWEKNPEHFYSEMIESQTANLFVSLWPD